MNADKECYASWDKREGNFLSTVFHSKPREGFVSPKAGSVRISPS